MKEIINCVLVGVKLSETKIDVAKSLFTQDLSEAGE